MKKKLFKLISSVLVVTCMLCCFAQPVCAVEPRWSNVNNILLTITTNASTLVIKAQVLGETNTTYSNGTVTLTRNGVTVGNWTGLSGNSPYFTFTNQTVPRQSGTYVLTIKITAGRNGVSEVVSSSKTVTY